MGVGALLIQITQAQDEGAGLHSKFSGDASHHRLDEHRFRQIGAVAGLQGCQLLLAHAQVACQIVEAQALGLTSLPQD